MAPARLALLVAAVLALAAHQASANPDAKRLYDDLLSTYNRLIRPVSNNTHTVLVKLGLRLSQLIELVSRARIFARVLPQHLSSLHCLSGPLSCRVVEMRRIRPRGLLVTVGEPNLQTGRSVLCSH